jgi:hypothetical protein
MFGVTAWHSTTSLADVSSATLVEHDRFEPLTLACQAKSGVSWAIAACHFEFEPSRRPPQFVGLSRRNCAKNCGTSSSAGPSTSGFVPTVMRDDLQVSRVSVMVAVYRCSGNKGTPITWAQALPRLRR